MSSLNKLRSVGVILNTLLIKFFWPIVILIFPMYSLFEPGVDLKFYGGLSLIFVTISSQLLYGKVIWDNRSRGLTLCSLLIFSLLFFNRPPANTLWIFQFICCSCGLVLLNHFTFLLEENPAIRRRIYWSMGVVGIISSTHMILNHWGLDPWTDLLFDGYRKVGGKFVHDIQGTMVPYGFLGNQNHSSMISVMCLPFMFNRRLWFGIPLTILAVILSKSSMSLGALAMTLYTLYLFWDNNPFRKVCVSILSIIPVVAILSVIPSLMSLSTRDIVWPYIVKWLDWKGRGLTAFSYQFMPWAKSHGMVVTEYWREAHCEYLEIYSILGIISIPILIFLLSRLRPNRQNYIWFASFVGLMVNSMGNFPWHLPFLALLGIITYTVSCINKENL